MTKNVVSENLCRICLETNSIFMNVFDEIDVDEGNIAEIIRECTSVKISPDDKFSKLVCAKCVDNLKQTYAFIQQCQRSDQALTKPTKKIVKCPYCPRKYRVQKNLQSHIMSEQCKWWVKSSPKKCIVCNVEVIRRRRFQRHLKQHFPRKRVKKINFQEEVGIDIKMEKTDDDFQEFVCTVCYETFNEEPKFTEHIETHIKTETYFCTICESDFKKLDEFKKHLETHDVFISEDQNLETDSPESINKYKCNGCPQTFPTAALLKQHLATQHQYGCCLEVFKNRSEYMKHREMHTKRKMAKCKICGKVLSACSMENHINLIHNKLKNHLCTVCGRAFGVRANLTVHMRIHTGEKPYECKICHQKFTQIQALYSHKISYHNENGKKHTCQICNKNFTRRETLKDHLNTHKPERSHKCETCHKMFKTKRTLADHQVVHSGARDFFCSNCSKSFPRYKALVIHLQSHSGIKPFKCLVCEREFSQKHLVLFHLKTHNIEPSDYDKYFIKNVIKKQLKK